MGSRGIIRPGSGADRWFELKSQVHQKLVNSLTEGLGSPKQVAEELLARAEIDPALRPQALTVADWVRLHRSVST